MHPWVVFQKRKKRFLEGYQRGNFTLQSAVLVGVVAALRRAPGHIPAGTEVWTDIAAHLLYREVSG